MALFSSFCYVNRKLTFKKCLNKILNNIMKPNFVQYLLVNISKLQIPVVKHRNIHCHTG